MTDADARLRSQVAGVVAERIAAVLAVSAGQVTPTTRLVADLHADSLDLVEIVESVESRLRAQGHQLRVHESQIADWVTVADAIEGVVAALRDDATA